MEEAIEIRMLAQAKIEHSLNMWSIGRGRPGKIVFKQNGMVKYAVEGMYDGLTMKKVLVERLDKLCGMDVVVQETDDVIPGWHFQMSNPMGCRQCGQAMEYVQWRRMYRCECGAMVTEREHMWEIHRAQTRSRQVDMMEEMRLGAI